MKITKHEPPKKTPDGKDLSPDRWWASVFKLDIPMIEKIITPALSLFTGAIVEGTFSEIQNSVTDKRNTMSASTISAIQTVRSAFRETPAADLFPVGRDSKPSQRGNAVTAVQLAYKEDAETTQQQRDEEEKKDKIYGVKRVTKRSVKDSLVESYSKE